MKYVVEIQNYSSGDGDYPNADAILIRNILDSYIERSDSDGTVIVTPHIDTVFLVWDNSRAEHGEDATLVDIYATREAAEKMMKRGNEEFEDDSGEYIGEPPFSVEEREVNQ